MKEKKEYVKPLVETVVMNSSILGRKVYYDVIEPEPSIDLGETRAVLYLLHGLFGDRTNWVEKTNILSYLSDKDFVVVCPDAGDHWYVERAGAEGPSYERFILDEVIPDAEQRFSAGGSRGRRAIAGISMGGYGAFKMAVRRPGDFCFAGSMSGAFHAASITEDEPRKEIVPSVMEVFSSQEVRLANDVFSLIRGSVVRGMDGRLPTLYFDCGDADELLPANRQLDRLLNELSVDHEYRELPGGHDWAYWDRNLSQLIDRVSDTFHNKALGRP